jgi:hypothetical protein
MVLVDAKIEQHLGFHPIPCRDGYSRLCRDFLKDVEMTKRLVITCIALTVGALHFIKGQNYQGPYPIFVNGYLIDVLLPMALYLLLSLFQNRLIRSPIFRACAVFGFGCVVEASQYFGHPIFGSTFDPFDIVAYAGGVLLGILLDLKLFPRFIPHWLEQ